MSGKSPITGKIDYTDTNIWTRESGCEVLYYYDTLAVLTIQVIIQGEMKTTGISLAGIDD